MYTKAPATVLPLACAIASFWLWDTSLAQTICGDGKCEKPETSAICLQDCPPGMVIQKAQYGTPGKYCDASELVKSLCEGRRKCSIAVDASVCDAPAPKRIDNTLTVYFACGENGGAMKGKRDETIEIVCE